MAFNPLMHFLASTAGSPIIAAYQTMNHSNGETSDFYIIRTDSYLIELARMAGYLRVEYRTVFDLDEKHVISYSIFPEKGMLYYKVTSFEDYFNTQPRIERTTDENGRDVLSIFDGEELRYRLTLSEGIPNMHHSALFIPEATSLPAEIVLNELQHTFHSILTDESQKLKILDSLKIDLDKYMVLDQGDLDQLTHKMFGASYDELVAAMEKRMKGS